MADGVQLLMSGALDKPDGWFKAWNTYFFTLENSTLKKVFFFVGCGLWAVGLLACLLVVVGCCVVVLLCCGQCVVVGSGLLFACLLACLLSLLD